jgi:hypothetical protein
MKTVRWRSGARTFALCDPCWEPISATLWIVPGHHTVHGVCRGCSGWFSLRDLSDVILGGKRGAPSGTCASCTREGR